MVYATCCDLCDGTQWTSKAGYMLSLQWSCPTWILFAMFVVHPVHANITLNMHRDMHVSSVQNCYEGIYKGVNL